MTTRRVDIPRQPTTAERAALYQAETRARTALYIPTRRCARCGLRLQLGGFRKINRRWICGPCQYPGETHAHEPSQVA